jgi:exopolysaccharide/PEP-CTERM locus tyrosine autokinase
MNDMTPPRKKGSLLERAQTRFDLDAPLLRPTQLGPAEVPASPDTAADAVSVEDAPVEDAPLPPGEVLRRRPASSSGLIKPSRPDIQIVDPAAPSAPMPRAPTQPRGTTRPPVARRPLFVGPAQTIDRRLLADHGLLNPDGGVDAMGEEFRLIKRQLMRGATADPRGHRILITSAQPDEGKTFTAINLALSLAQEQERSVLLIDGDFARGDVARRLGLSSECGLMDALVDPSVDIARCIIPTDINNLAVLPAGQASPRDTEMLGSARMLEILNRLQGDAPERFLVFDSTPLLAASSAGVLAALSGQVLVVVRAEVTREAALRDAIGLIGQHNGISLLLNRVRFTPEGRRFGSYYGEGG